MASNLIKAKNIETAKVTSSEPKVLDNGSKLVYVNYLGGRFNVQTSWMELPWDMSCYDEGPYPKYNIELSFRGHEDNEDLNKTLIKFKELDEKIIDLGVSKSVQLFKKKTSSREVIEGHYSRMVRYSIDKETGEINHSFPPSLKIKIPCKDNVFDVKLFKKGQKEACDINDPESHNRIGNLLVKKAKVRCILQCVGLWIASGNYMCQWKLLKAEVDVPETTNCDFIPDSDEE